jgi:hypothetical protein
MDSATPIRATAAMTATMNPIMVNSLSAGVKQFLNWYRKSTYYWMVTMLTITECWFISSS